jgi:anti-sigma-K factor RskA
MSGTDTDDRAGLYVLGALNAEEMRELRAEAERDAALRGEISAWERRLTPLAALIPLVEVPATLWAQLEARLARIGAPGQAVAEIYQPPLRPRTRRRTEARALVFWRTTALAAMAAAAVLGGLLVVRRAPPSPVLAMIMPAQPGLGGWLITLRANGEVNAVAQGALSHTLKQDFQLWALAEGSERPVPLGLLAVSGKTGLPPPADLPRQKFKLLVSLEPAGGSPTGLPTGPVVYSSGVVTR